MIVYDNICHAYISCILFCFSLLLNGSGDGGNNYDDYDGQSRKETKNKEAFNFLGAEKVSSLC